MSKKLPLTTLNAVQAAVIDVLLQHPFSSIAEIKERVEQDHGLSFSRQHFYKVLADMRTYQLVSKVKSGYVVEMRWIAALQNYCQGAMTNLSNMKWQTSDFPLEEGQRKEYFAKNLSALDPIWDNITLSLFRLTGEEEELSYTPHLYWRLNTRYSFQEFERLCSIFKLQSYELVGSSSPLDVYAKSLITSDTIDRTVTLCSDSPFTSEGFTFQVIGDYLIEFVMPPSLRIHFDNLFATVESVKELNQDYYNSIFTIEEMCKLTVSRNPAKAAKFAGIVSQNCK